MKKYGVVNFIGTVSSNEFTLNQPRPAFAVDCRIHHDGDIYALKAIFASNEHNVGRYITMIGRLSMLLAGKGEAK